MSEKLENTTLTPLTLSAEGFRAKTLVLQAASSASMENDLDCGLSSTECFANYDPNTHSLRTWQTCLFSDSTAFCQTLPEAGLMRSGKCYLVQPLAPLMSVRGFSSLPTPGARDYRDVSMKAAYAASLARHQPSLATEILLAGIGGQRIGQIYEWVMGFPHGFLANGLRDTEMPSNPQSPNGLENELSSLTEDVTPDAQDSLF